jgi:predicted lipoprotein with Yx(FWY)xxD motif
VTRFRFGLRPLLVLTLLIGLVAVACGGTSTPSGSSAKSSPTPAAKAVVTTKTITVNGSSVTVLADPNGMTLYYFTPDKGGTVTCSGACLEAWPPLLLPTGTSKPTGGNGVTGTLGTVSASVGTVVTYNGWPLYTYAKDTSTSDGNGNGAAAGKWLFAKPDTPATTA